jgi:hypothetical protein
MFRLSKTRFQVLMEDVMAADIAFYQQRKNLHADDQASLEAQLLLPIKCLAYGVPSHNFINYFQMSKQYPRECCKQFDVAIKTIYHKEYLCLPTMHDLKSILKSTRQFIRWMDSLVALIAPIQC